MVEIGPWSLAPLMVSGKLMHLLWPKKVKIKNCNLTSVPIYNNVPPLAYLSCSLLKSHSELRAALGLLASIETFFIP